MKNLLIILLIINLTGLLPSCKAPATGPKNYVKVVTNAVSTSGVLALESTGIAKKKEQAKRQAVKNAMEAVLFEGIPNSSVKRPLINDPSARQKHREYFDRFFSDGGKYLQFAQTYSINPRETTMVGRYYNVVLRMDVNYRSLQKELENANIIQKFGI